jgi:hypothetical protein
MRDYNDIEKVRQLVARDIATAATGLVQAVKDRDKRKMGSLAGDPPERIRRMILVAQALTIISTIFLEGYFLPMFAKYARLRKRAEERNESSAVRDLDMKVKWFRPAYKWFREIHEAALSYFDLPFDQFQTVQTMLGIGDEADREYHGTKWITADVEQLQKRSRARYAKEDEITDGEKEKGTYPRFGEALVAADKNKDDIPTEISDDVKDLMPDD